MLIFFKILIEGVRLAIQELWANGLRTFLSILGITIGIFCVIAVLTMVDSVEKNVRQSLERLGNDVIYINRFPWNEEPGDTWWKYRKRPNPSFQDFKAIQERVGSADLTAMRIFLAGRRLKYSNNTIDNSVVIGGTNDFGYIYNFDFESGRYFSLSEANLGHNVMILGHTIAQELFPMIDPVGKFVKYMGRKVRVIGVLKKEGESILGDGFDQVAILPFNYLRRYVDVNSRFVSPMIVVKAKKDVNNEQLEEEIAGTLRATRKLKPIEENNFALNKISFLSNILDSIFGVINIAGWLIGIFAILVGGFGIANIMFVSVKERTNIIGIKKSLGAKNHFILFEFLIESICLCFLGGLLGLALVSLLTWVGTYFIESFKLVLSYNNVLVGMFMSVIIGCIAGFIPALSAARLNPVEAIRHN